eukprot:s1112_g8.t1
MTTITVGEKVSARPTGAYCYFPMLRFHSASFSRCLGLTPVSMTSASAQLTQLGGNYANSQLMPDFQHRSLEVKLPTIWTVEKQR